MGTVIAFEHHAESVKRSGQSRATRHSGSGKAEILLFTGIWQEQIVDRDVGLKPARRRLTAPGGKAKTRQID